MYLDARIYVYIAHMGSWRMHTINKIKGTESRSSKALPVQKLLQAGPITILD